MKVRAILSTESPCNAHSSFNVIKARTNKMKNVICILVLLCTVYVSQQSVLDPSRNLQRLVNIEKKATEAIFIALSVFEKRMKQNMEVKLDTPKADALFEVTEVINEAFEDVKLSIEQGKKEHKKVEECYGYAKNTLETKNENTIAELEVCVRNGHMAMETPLMNVARTVEAAQSLLTDLDAIIPKCYSPIHIKMEACVMKELVLSRSTLKRIKQNAKDVANTATITYVKMISDAKSCMKREVTGVRTESTDVIVRTNSCIRNAPTGDPKSIDVLKS